jgi:hypothetical protein
MAKDNKLRIKITTDISGGIKQTQYLRTILGQLIEFAVERTAKILLRDCRPYIPMLTGRLRDSGRTEEIKSQLFNYSVKLIWDAANPLNGYVYAARQYHEVFNHVDGRYAAKWVERVLIANPDRYTMLVARYMTIGLRRTMQLRRRSTEV